MSRDAIDIWLTRAVDAGLAGVVFLVPFVMGGRQAAGQAVLILLALALGIGWCLKQALAGESHWTHSAAQPILLLTVVWVALQLIRLPSTMLAKLSPHVYQILPLWAPSAEGSTLGIWQTLSLDPGTTRSCLLLLISFAIVFTVAVQRIRRVEDVEWLLRIIALATVAMAAFGLVQFFAGNGKFFWIYEDPFSSTNLCVKGSFTCRNHFAHFIALGLGPVLWWLFHGTLSRNTGRVCGRRETWRSASEWLPLAFHLLVLAVCVLAVLLSLSRGGFVALCTAAAVCLILLYRAGAVNRKVLLGSAAVAATLTAVAVGYGYEHVAKRLDDLQSLEELGLHGTGGRPGVWKAGLRAIADYPLTGTGLGTHGDVHRMYLDQPGTEYTHAENGYIQVAMEAGLPGLFLACAGLAIYCFWCVSLAMRSRRPPVQLALVAIAPAIAASAVHSLGDFVWYVPGCMVIVVILAACACRLYQIDRRQSVAGTLGWPTADESTSSRSTGTAGEIDATMAPRAARRALLKKGTGSTTSCTCPQGKPLSVVVPVPFFSINDAHLLYLVVAGCLLAMAAGIVPSVIAAIPAEQAWHAYLKQHGATTEKENSKREEACREMLETLSSVVNWQPTHSRARARMAALHLELFERLQSRADPPFGIAQIRDAALASQFPSSAALQQWLSKVAGPNLIHLNRALVHARRSLACCPLQAPAYLALAKLSFLEGPNSIGKSAYVAQAVNVRPLDGDVAFAAGIESLLAGRTEEAIAHWRTCFQTGQHQQDLLDAFSARLPVAVFLDEFQPDLEGIRRIERHYKNRGRDDALPAIRARHVQAAESAAETCKGKEAARLWREAARVYRALEAQQDWVRCLRRTLDSDPSCFDARLELAKTLLELEEFAEAEKELMNCRRRRPYDQNVQKLLERAVDQRIRLTRRTSTPPN